MDEKRARMQDWYEKEMRPLETEEFVVWFEGWYGDETSYGDLLGSDYKEEYLDDYLSERRFALVGWLARELPKEVREDNIEFCFRLFGEKGRHGKKHPD